MPFPAFASRRLRERGSVGRMRGEAGSAGPPHPTRTPA
jgi:hypothetical protein